MPGSPDSRITIEAILGFMERQRTMKYEIIVEKMENKTFTAHCPAVPRMQIYADTLDGVLGIMRREFLCYVHDPNAEFEIKVGGSAVPRGGNSWQEAAQ